MKRAIGALIACLFITLAIVSVSSPAQAGWHCDQLGECGDLRHYSPDEGADGPILVTGNFGNPWSATQNVYEGESSTFRDVDGFWVGAGETITCWTGHGTRFSYSSYGWHKIVDTDNYVCVRGTG